MLQILKNVQKFYSLVSASLAFLLWGSWAYYANSGSLSEKRFGSALTQGTLSFLLTFLMIRVVIFYYGLLPSNQFRSLIASLLTVFTTGSFLILAHTIAGTGNIAKTVSPPLGVAFLFCYFTALKIKPLT